MATAPRRTGQGSPVRRTVPGMLRVSGVAGFYCSHAPSHRRYVDADFEGTILTALWEPASWSRPSRGRLLGAGPYAAFFMMVKAGPPSDSRPERQPARGRRPHVLVSWRPDRLMIFSEV